MKKNKICFVDVVCWSLHERMICLEAVGKLVLALLLWFILRVFWQMIMEQNNFVQGFFFVKKFTILESSKTTKCERKIVPIPGSVYFFPFVGNIIFHCCRELGKSLNILDYEFNYSSFWLLDVLSKHLKDMQLKNFSSSHQETFLSWFRFVLRCISSEFIHR